MPFINLNHALRMCPGNVHVRRLNSDFLRTFNFLFFYAGNGTHFLSLLNCKTKECTFVMEPW